AAGDPGRARHADVVRETGAGREPGTRRCWPRAGAARPKLARARCRRLPRAARLSEPLRPGQGRMTTRGGEGSYSMSVVLAGGGTAGPIEPALAAAAARRRADPRIEIICLGTERGLETRLVPLRGYELALIPAVPLPRSLTPDLLSVPGRLNGAISAAADALDDAGADVVVGFGGYVATPAYLAARRRRIPIVVHEANSRPGLANKIGAR